MMKTYNLYEWIHTPFRKRTKLLTWYPMLLHIQEVLAAEEAWEAFGAAEVQIAADTDLERSPSVSSETELAQEEGKRKFKDLLTEFITKKLHQRDNDLRSGVVLKPDIEHHNS